jgi:hypothetical protein
MGSVFRAHFFDSKLAFVSRNDSLRILDLTIDDLDCWAVCAVQGNPGLLRLGQSESSQIVLNRRATD